MIWRGHFNYRAGLVGLATFVSLGSLWADDTITREGRYWVRTITGSGVVTQPRMLLRTNGDVTVRGSAKPGYSYTMKLRARAASAEQARRRLGELRMMTAPSGDTLVLNAPQGEGSSDLRLEVPSTVKEVMIATAGGGVDVSDLPASIRAETAGGGVRCDRIGGNVDVATGGGGISLGVVDGSVHCATGGGSISATLIRGQAVFSTGGGDIVVQEVDGVLQVSTQGGGIKISRAGSAVVASTGGGPIQIDRAGGKVTAKSSAGPIRVDSANDVQCVASAGGIRLRNISGSLHASTASGSIIAALLANQPFMDSLLSTGSGDITVFIPSNLGVTIHAESRAADSLRRIISDFPGVAVRLEGSVAIGHGPINGGGPLLEIRGNNGTIYIKKQ